MASKPKPPPKTLEIKLATKPSKIDKRISIASFLYREVVHKHFAAGCFDCKM